MTTDNEQTTLEPGGNLTAEQLDEMDYNDRYDATVAKGLCLECGGKVQPYWSLDEWFTPVWCANCNFEIGANGAINIGDQ